MINNAFGISTGMLAVLALGLGTTLSSSAASAPSSQRDSSTWHQEQVLIAGQLEFKVNGVRPSRARVSGISRGGACSINGMPITMTALLPKSSADALHGQMDVESTVASHPTFFVYIPSSPAKMAELTLSDETDSPIYQSNMALPDQPGVVGFSVPSSAPALQVGGIYHWSVALRCDPSDRSGDLIVDGWVQRVDVNPNLAAQLEQASPRDRPTLYAQDGIWQDTLSTLAELRLANPQDRDLQTDWISLLNSVDLGGIAQAPLLTIR
jgi:hypothetical protein